MNSEDTSLHHYAALAIIWPILLLLWARKRTYTRIWAISASGTILGRHHGEEWASFKSLISLKVLDGF